MFDINILASGSSGNCYILSNIHTCIMLDCGLPFNKLHKLMHFRLPDNIFVSHEHSDHSKAVKDYLNRGVNVFMSNGTADALHLQNHYRLHKFNHGDFFNFGVFTVYPFIVSHDATQPVGFIFEDLDDRILYITDSGNIPKLNGVFTKILIEANHSSDLLHQCFDEGSLDSYQFNRISRFHLSIDNVIKFLLSINLSPVKEIYLIHLSHRHADSAHFKEVIEILTGKSVFV